jgi:hypothetical protein
VVRVTSSAEGLLRARLKSRGDWDLGVFDAKTKRYVAGSAGPRGNELAEGFSGPVQVVDVSTPTRDHKRRLQTLGLDLTEHGDADSIEVVLYGEEDAQVLRRNKFRYTVRIADLERRNEANRRADRRYSARVAQTGSQLPAGARPTGGCRTTSSN